MAAVARVRDAITTLIESYDEMKVLTEKKSAELAECKSERTKRETKLAELHKKMIDAEYALLKKQQDIDHNLDKISELERTATECQKMNEGFAQKLLLQDRSMEELQLQLENANSQAASVTKTYSETLERLRDARNSHERLDKEGEKAANILLELEKERSLLAIKLKKLDSQEEAGKRQKALNDIIDSLTLRLDEVVQKARQDEDTAEELSIQLTVLEDESSDLTEKIQDLKDQLFTMKSTIQDE